MTLAEPVDELGKAYKLIAENTAPATLTIFGFVLLGLAVYAAYRGINSTPEKTPKYVKATLFISLIFGIIFSAAGPTLALLYYAEGPIRTVSKEEAIDNVRDNQRVYWLIRLVSFNPNTDPDLAISRLTNLGHPTQKFAFVAPYEELRGYKVSKAVSMFGVAYDEGTRNHVSAIIFKVDRQHHLYPANARGLLQVILDVEKDMDPAKDKLLLPSNVLSKAEADDLDTTNDDNIKLYSWRWDNYRDKYPHYCQMAHQFRCDVNYSARRLIGGLYNDWHPIGIAREEQENPCKMSAASFCGTTDWDTLRNTLLPHFGSRVFLIQNMAISTLGDRYLIDFGDPPNQVIPDIGFRPPPKSN